jgi:lambda family phage portal protein
MSLLSRLFPGWDLRRKKAKALSTLLTRALHGGVSDRTSGWRQAVQESINQKARKDLTTTRAQGRNLYLLNAYARHVINAMVANLVGCGIKPQSRVMMPRKYEPIEPFNDKVDTAWERWAEAEGFYWKQGFTLQEKLVAGEILVRFATPTDGRDIPLTLDLIKSERLALNNTFRNRPPNVVQGIEFDRNGTRSAYWIYPEEPSDQALMQSDPVRVPADQILHIYDPLEPGQIRGLSRFMTTGGTFEAINQYLDFLMLKERIAASFALMITRQQGLNFPTPDGSTSQTDPQGNTQDYFEGGMIFHGQPGEDIKGVSSAVQPEEVDKMIQVMLRMAACGFDTSYELISRDLSEVTYLSARQGENQDRRIWEPQQTALNRQFNCPVRKEFIRLGSVMGKWRIPDGQLDQYCAAEWIPDGWDWVDPSKDVKSSIEAMKAGLIPPQEVMAKQGRDWFDVLNQFEAFKAVCKEKGLVFTTFPDMVAEAEAAAQPEPEAPEEPTSEETNTTEAA